MCLSSKLYIFYQSLSSCFISCICLQISGVLIVGSAKTTARMHTMWPFSSPFTCRHSLPFICILFASTFDGLALPIRSSVLLMSASITPRTFRSSCKPSDFSHPYESLILQVMLNYSSKVKRFLTYHTVCVHHFYQIPLGLHAYEQEFSIPRFWRVEPYRSCVGPKHW